METGDQELYMWQTFFTFRSERFSLFKPKIVIAETYSV